MELNNQPRLRPRQKTKKKMKATDIKPGTLIQYADGEVWRVTRPGYMRPHNDAAKKANISLEIAMQEEINPILAGTGADYRIEGIFNP